MDKRAAFRRGFIARCAEAGLTLQETFKLAADITARLEKKAEFDPLGMASNAVSGVGNAVTSAAKEITPWALGGLILAPPAAGYLGGKLMAKLTDYDDTDVNEIKKRELVDEYLRNAAKLRYVAPKPTAVRRTRIR